MYYFCLGEGVQLCFSYLKRHAGYIFIILSLAGEIGQRYITWSSICYYSSLFPHMVNGLWSRYVTVTRSGIVAIHVFYIPHSRNFVMNFYLFYSATYKSNYISAIPQSIQKYNNLCQRVHNIMVLIVGVKTKCYW